LSMRSISMYLSATRIPNDSISCARWINGIRSLSESASSSLVGRGSNLNVMYHPANWRVWNCVRLQVQVVHVDPA
jgi:hypothetical protein